MEVSAIEDIHGMLIKDLGINRNIRNHRVVVIGTNYVPLDNDHQIKDTIIQMCNLVNSKQNVFEKALLCWCYYATSKRLMTVTKELQEW